MENVVRIEEIKIENFKNVKYGNIVLKNNKKKYHSNILGIYGQNGSGKTALIDAIMLLKYALCSDEVPSSYSEYIHVDFDYSKFNFKFSVECLDIKTSFIVNYEFKLKKESDETSTNILEADQYKAIIFDEVLSCSYTNDKEKKIMSVLIQSDKNNSFASKSKFEVLFGDDPKTKTNLIVAQELAYSSSRSFIFSPKLLSIVKENCSHTVYKCLIETLVNYGQFELFVINTHNSGLITFNALPLTFKYEGKTSSISGNITLPLDEAKIIPQEVVDVVEQIIPHMNTVLSTLVPGLSISMYNFGPQLLKNGQVGCRVQLMSNKNNKEIPLRYESEGIKKIISILQLLIVVYNKPSITVAIDELDAGVFEYLLGELLKIISEKGHGQLIFTSHNLRPLETLDKCFIAFTTTNPDNRYIRLTNVKGNNNLRSFYYRDIVLGEQSETVYDYTNNSKIAFAFKKAGKIL